MTDGDPRPALAKLNRDQRDAVADVLDGFGSRRDVVEWFQRAIIATLGELDDDLFQDVLLSGSWLSMLMAEEAARAEWAPTGEAPDDEAAAEFRRLFVAREVTPAARRAHRRFRWKANEYVDEALSSPDPAVQSHPGMRPALSSIEDEQARELRRLLDGYADEAALLDAVLRWNQATYAEHDAGLSVDVLEERHLRAHLLRDSPHAEAVEFRERFATVHLLPAFNRAVRQLSERTTEAIESESTKLEAKSL